MHDTLATWYCEDDSAANCQAMPSAASSVRPSCSWFLQVFFKAGTQRQFWCDVISCKLCFL